MDITALFKASVKTVRLRNKSLPALDKNRILKKSSKNEFTIKTTDICHQITQLKNLLIENRSAYMRFGYHLKSSVQMSDEERDIIDQESEKIIQICTQFIGDLKQDCNKLKIPKQAAQHMEGVLELLSDYLRAVYKIYNQQKAYRIKHELDTYKLLKLESNKKLIPVIPVKERVKIELTNGHDSEILNGSNGNKENEGVDSDDDDDDDVTDQVVERNETRIDEDTIDKRLISKNVAVDEDIASKFALEQDEISAEDIQMFESENHQLYNELKGLSDEVEQIEKNVVEIAKLQEVFTEKVSSIKKCIIIMNIIIIEFFFKGYATKNGY